MECMLVHSVSGCPFGESVSIFTVFIATSLLPVILVTSLLKVLSYSAFANYNYDVISRKINLDVYDRPRGLRAICLIFSRASRMLRGAIKPVRMPCVCHILVLYQNG